MIVGGLESQAQETGLDVGIEKSLKGCDEGKKTLLKGDRFASHMGSVGGPMWVIPAWSEDASFVACGIEGLRKTLCGERGQNSFAGLSEHPPVGLGLFSGTEENV